MIKIIDNFLNDDLIKHLEFFYSFRSPHFYGQHSRLDVKKQIWFYYSELNLNLTFKVKNIKISGKLCFKWVGCDCLYAMVGAYLFFIFLQLFNCKK